MKRVLKDFIFDMIRQFFGWSKPREGEIIYTPYSLRNMRECDLDIATLEDVFRHGVGNKHKIVQRYSSATVGIYYKTLKPKPHQSQPQYLITTCWKRKR